MICGKFVQKLRCLSWFNRVLCREENKVEFLEGQFRNVCPQKRKLSILDHATYRLKRFQIQMKVKKKKPVVKLIVQTSFAAKIKAEGSVTFQFQNIFSSMADFCDVNAAMMMQPE